MSYLVNNQVIIGVYCKHKTTTLKHVQFRKKERKNRVSFGKCSVKIVSNRCETLEHFCFAQT